MPGGLAAVVPDGLDRATAARVSDGIDQAFVAGFRWTMGIAAGLAALGAAAAALTIERQAAPAG